MSPPEGATFRDAEHLRRDSIETLRDCGRSHDERLPGIRDASCRGYERSRPYGAVNLAG
jgi:hypothetical protein